MESRKILVVEDEIDLEFLFTRKLKSHIRSKGWQFFFTTNGHEALQCLEKHPDIAVVVSDINMPRMDGLTLLQHLNARYPLLRTIIITAYNTLDNIRTVVSRGAFDFLPKPLDMTILTQSLERTLREVHQMRTAMWTSRLLETAMNTTELGILVTDQQGRIVYVNPADARMHGYTVDELLGQPGTIFGPPEQDARFPENLVFPWKRQRLNRRKDGSVFPVTLISNPMYDLHNRPSGKVVVCEDLTGRQRTEETLCLLMDLVADGLVVIQEGAVVQVNTALCAIFKEPAEHLTQMDPETLLGAQANPGDVRENSPPPLVGGIRGGGAKQLDTLEHSDILSPPPNLPHQGGGMLKSPALGAQASLPALPDHSWQIRQVTHGGREFWLETSQRTIYWVGKPVLLVTVRDITAHHKKLMTLRTELHDRYRFRELVGKSPAMQQVYERIAQAAATDEAVVIYGESGTGKELVAKTIHQLSARAGHPFVPVNCGAIPEGLFESQFFGHRKGAFTGADATQSGFFKAAHQGTLFLDEAGELSQTVQAKLLRALQDGEYTPVGKNIPQQADVRIITATNRPFTELVMTGAMREDFFYRLQVIPITVPPLRERKEDLPLLIDHILRRTDMTSSDLPAAILTQLYSYEWPGNVRELQTVLSRYLSMGILEFDNLCNLNADEPETDSLVLEVEGKARGGKLRAMVEAFEKRILIQTLEQHNWHRTRTAKALGIPVRSLRRKMEQHQILPPSSQ